MRIEKYLKILERVDKKLSELKYTQEQKTQIVTEIVKNLTII